MGRAGVLPLPQPSRLSSACFSVVPGGESSLPECIACLDDWAAALNDMNAGGSSCFRFDESASPPAATQLSVIGTAEGQIERFTATPRVEDDAAAFAAVCGGLDYGDSPASFIPMLVALLPLRPKGSSASAF